MPSHVTHLLFAEDVAADTGLSSFAQGGKRAFLVLGAQGPDIFYHNQRRKPSGLSYGSLIHRHDYGALCAEMAGWGWEHDLEVDSWLGAWVAGFASHAILDRHTHPYINYFAGWVEPGDPHTNRFRSMHPFLERLIDVEVLRRLRKRHPVDIGFYSAVNCGVEPPPDWLDMMSGSLSATFSKAARDVDLRKRLTAAYLDTMGYYSFTDVVDKHYLETAVEREDAGQIGARWLSIVHPPEVPSEVDVLNMSRTTWCHPCSHLEIHQESFLDLYAAARAEAAKATELMAKTWTRAMRTGGDHTAEKQVVTEAVGNGNLSDGRPHPRPCEKRHAGPLPLRELQALIRQSIREGRGGTL